LQLSSFGMNRIRFSLLDSVKKWYEFGLFCIMKPKTRRLRGYTKTIELALVMSSLVPSSKDISSRCCDWMGSSLPFVW
jgi:hypothetical protein